MPAIPRIIELGHRGEHVTERPLDRCPVPVVELLPAFMRQEAGKAEIRLAAIDELLLAIGNRLGGVLRRRQIERLANFQYPAIRRTLRRNARRSIGTEMARPMTAPASSADGWRQ